MKILIISPAYPPAPAGEAEHCHQIASHLGSAGHQVTVLTGRHAAPVEPAGFELRMAMPGWSWRQLPALARQLRSLRPDGVILIYATWLFDAHPMITFLPTLMRRVCPRARLLTLMEIYQEPAVGSAAARAGRKLAAWLAGGTGIDYAFGTLLRDSHTVAALGPTIVAKLERHTTGLAARALVIPPPPLVERLRGLTPARRHLARQALGGADGALLMAYFGYVYPGKGVQTLFAALRLLRARGRNVRLVMAGGGRGAALAGQGGRHDAFESEMRALALRLGISDSVSWSPGYAGGSDAVALELMACDLAVLPFDDGAELRRSSIAVVASMGLALITTQPSQHEPAFVDGDSVLLCPPRNAEALATAVERVADDHDLHLRLQSGAVALARDWFSWDGAIGKLAHALAPPRA
jgi:glycosyltransferase involved in cell wall biosynthesis